MPDGSSSLRQRHAYTNGEPLRDVAAPCQGDSQKVRTGLRLNKVLGRIVPLILLAYVYYTYNLVVVCYGVHLLHSSSGWKRSITVVWLLVLHLVFLTALRSYFHVFFAHNANHEQPRTILGWLRQQLGASFPDPIPRDSGLDTNQKSFAGNVELCSPDGSPVLCFRDQCNGRVKTFRTRHCGDCGTCRLGFDHHCAWFDNDITAPATLRSFLLFLGCVPPLIGLAVGPLASSAWQTARQIATFALADGRLRHSWWDCWYSWLGGPVFRWMVGWCIAARRWSRAADASDRLPYQLVSGPFVVGFGVVLIIIASSLASSTLLNLSDGLLTVDIERSKEYKRLSRRRDKLVVGMVEGQIPSDDATVRRLKAKMQSLSPVSHFRVTSTTHISIIIPVFSQDGLFSRGKALDNLRYFLWDREAREQMEHSCTLSQQAYDHISATISQEQSCLPKQGHIRVNSVVNETV